MIGNGKEAAGSYNEERCTRIWNIMPFRVIPDWHYYDEAGFCDALLSSEKLFMKVTWSIRCMSHHLTEVIID